MKTVINIRITSKQVEKMLIDAQDERPTQVEIDKAIDCIRAYFDNWKLFLFGIED